MTCHSYFLHEELESGLTKDAYGANCVADPRESLGLVTWTL